MARFYTVQETAAILGFSTNSIYKFLDQGRLKSTRGNSKQGRFRIPHSSIEDFLGTKLPEAAVSRALAAASQPKTADMPRHLINPDLTPPPPMPAKKVARPLPTTTPTEALPSRTHLPLGVAITRLLILVALLLTIIEAITAPVVTLTGQFFRLAILAIAILLAYQSGGSLTDQPHDHA